MPNPVWPVNLPQNILLGYQESIDPNYMIESAVDVGVAKRRLRYTVPVRKFSASLYMSTSQKDVLELFFNTYATSRWDWIDPDPPNSAITCRFIPGSIPSYTRVAPDLFNVSFGFEVLP